MLHSLVDMAKYIPLACKQPPIFLLVSFPASIIVATITTATTSRFLWITDDLAAAVVAPFPFSFFHFAIDKAAASKL